MDVFSLLKPLALVDVVVEPVVFMILLNLIYTTFNHLQRNMQKNISRYKSLNL